jgi:hypothetical protein
LKFRANKDDEFAAFELPEAQMAPGAGRSRVIHRVVTTSYTFYVARRQYRIVGDNARPSIFHQEIRVEISPKGAITATYQDRPLQLVDRGIPKPPNANRTQRPPNAGGKSLWMRDFFNRPGPLVWASHPDALRMEEHDAFAANFSRERRFAKLPAGQ